MTNFCTAITLKGTRCKCKALSDSKFCKIHLPRDLTHKNGICDYITDARKKDGYRCKCQNKVVGKEFTFCKEHIDIKIFCENLVNNENVGM